MKDLVDIFFPDALMIRTAAWVQQRNWEKGKVNWHFSNQEARVKLERLYPEVNPS